MSTLVIKDWRVNSKPIDEKNNFVSITGREGGLIAWILSRMGIDPTTTILVGPERIEFSSSSLAGTESRLIPLQGVCSSYYGYHKPWKVATTIISTGVIIGIAVSDGISKSGSISSFMVIFSIGIIIALIYYFLNRTLTLGFVEHSGVVNGIKFKRSIIENVDINQEQAKAVCIIVQRLLEAKEKRAHQAVKE
jgi:hypothetical protein